MAPLAARAQADGARGETGSYAQIVKHVAPSVVAVLVESDVSRIEGFFGRSYGGVVRGGGSGLVIRGDGIIVTNYHVLEHAVRIEIELHDRRTIRARVIGVDPATDLAVVQIDVSGLQPARFADSSRAVPGDRVLAIGAPFGLRHTVTAGVISAVGRVHVQRGVVTRYLQTDAGISPGNSGGPLVNMAGEVVGINTANLGEGSAVGFSIPANLVRDVSNQLLRSRSVARGYIGIHVQPLDARLVRYFKLRDDGGALVNRVDKDSPAAQAGIAVGDIVLTFGGEPISDAAELLERVARSRIDADVTLRVQRNGAPTTAVIGVGRPPRSSAAPANASGRVNQDALLGMNVRALTPVLRHETGYNGPAAVVVAGVAPGSPADRAGVRPGFAILQADLRAVTAPRDLLAALADGSVLLLVEGEKQEAAYVLVQAE